MMKLACKNAERVRGGETIPLALLSLLCNYCLPLLPLSLARIAFRSVKFLFIGGLAGRMRNKLARLFRGADDSQSHFEHQYRHIQENHRWSGAANQIAMAQHEEPQRPELRSGVLLAEEPAE
jgi:hypothetical protein